jgi:hypothetical protein
MSVDVPTERTDPADSGKYLGGNYGMAVVAKAGSSGTLRPGKGTLDSPVRFGPTHGGQDAFFR